MISNQANDLWLSGGLEGIMFKEFFYHADFGVAITDNGGNVLTSNTQFSRFNLTNSTQPIFQDLLGERYGLLHTISYGVGADHFKISRSTVMNKGESYFVWVVSRDLEKEANSKLGILLDLYRSFIDTTFEMIFRTNREGKILFANRLFIKHFGFANYKLAKASNVKHLFESEEKYNELLAKLDAEKRISSEVVFFKMLNGARLTGRLNASVHVDGQGNKTLNWAMLNVSEQMDNENKINSRNEELAKVNNQMEKFLYSTSHDLRSPLTSILGLVNLIKMERNQLAVLDYVSKIEGSTLKLDKIIKDIMSFSRSTYQRLSSEKIDFEALTWRAINNHQADPVLRKISLDVKLNGSFPFFGDSERIEIILENIFRNAIHFYDPNKSRPFVRINISVQKEEAHLEFIDNGIGIGQQHLTQVFTMFYKASHLSKGAGLGLFIVKETLERINGTVLIESEIGFGTVVRITIPNDSKGKLMSRKLELQQKVVNSVAPRS